VLPIVDRKETRRESSLKAISWKPKFEASSRAALRYLTVLAWLSRASLATSPVSLVAYAMLLGLAVAIEPLLLFAPSPK
jgi:hypothetical protein